MTLKESYAHFEVSKKEVTEWLVKEIAGMRSGRVRSSLVEDLAVEHYGTRMSLNGLASITASDARTLVISPWDPTAVASIKKALVNAQIGVAPIEDGKVIRLSFPSFTEEARTQTVRMLNKKAEEARVRLRKIRDEALALIKKGKQAGDLTEDDFYEGREKLDGLIDDANGEIATIAEQKEKEIMNI
jgi:ribosome recycling factor